MCEDCRTRWYAGTNLFSAPAVIAEEDPTYLEESRRALADYREVSGEWPPWVAAWFQAQQAD